VSSTSSSRQTLDRPISEPTNGTNSDGSIGLLGMPKAGEFTQLKKSAVPNPQTSKHWHSIAVKKADRGVVRSDAEIGQV
jgi:hypothetical protein